jgi:hypothetical protein
MDLAPLGLGLTPHGHLFLTHDPDVLRPDGGLQNRLLKAFERGAGHGLLVLGADEVGDRATVGAFLLARIRRALRDGSLRSRERPSQPLPTTN